MIQGGDPTGTGKGGETIWGSPLRDEFSLEHKFLFTSSSLYVSAALSVCLSISLIHSLSSDMTEGE
jgi:cyclophilin family peptidyl-prolyl cis-trans isomerase